MNKERKNWIDIQLMSHSHNEILTTQEAFAVLKKLGFETFPPENGNCHNISIKKESLPYVIKIVDDHYILDDEGTAFNNEDINHIIKDLDRVLPPYCGNY